MKRDIRKQGSFPLCLESDAEFCFLCRSGHSGYPPDCHLFYWWLTATWQHGHGQNAMNDKQTGNQLFSKCSPTSRRYNIFHTGPLSPLIKCLNRAMILGVYGSKKLRAMICANVVTTDLETSFVSYCAFIFFSILYTITVGHHWPQILHSIVGKLGQALN